MARAYRSPHHDSKFWMNKEDRREISRNDKREDYSDENDDATSSDSERFSGVVTIYFLVPLFTIEYTESTCKLPKVF